MRILFATSEAAPFAKVGGLADVMGSLPPVMAEAGHEVSVVMPLYAEIPQAWREKMTFLYATHVKFGWRSSYCGVFSLAHAGVTWYFLDNESYFRREIIYGHFDDGERFAYFSRAVVDLIDRLKSKPDIVHCNDWQTALVPLYLKDLGRDGPRTVFTIHNIEYQGVFDRRLREELFGLSPAWDQRLEFYGQISLMKGAIDTADAVTTVSPTYAEELSYPFFARGLEGVIAANRHKLRGILNGIDMALHNPATDPALCANYSPENPGPKKKNKQALQNTLQLAELPETPVIGCVSRLVPQKGFGLIIDQIGEMMELDVQLVVLGVGDWQYEAALRRIADTYPGRCAVITQHSAALASLIYAGADLFLMPSASEPCGISQMIAMRYGTVPVVHAIGGLRDTVPPWNPETGEGRGFTFQSHVGGDMLDAVRRAINTYQNPEEWARIMRAGMTAPLGWEQSAREYKTIYEALAPQ